MILEKHDFPAGCAGVGCRRPGVGARGRPPAPPRRLALVLVLVPALAFVLPEPVRGDLRVAGSLWSPGREAGARELSPLQATDTVPADQLTVDSTAFRDSTALAVFTAARRYQMETDSTIRSYEAVRRQRFSVELRTPLRDRTLYHAEAASRIRWSPEGVVEQYLASRETTPEGVEPPGGLVNLSEIFDPAASPYSWDDTEESTGGRGGEAEGEEGDEDDVDVSVSVAAEDFLAPGSEEHYRFRTADSLTLGFPDGRRIRAIALEVVPRERSGRLGSGMIWIEPESGALIRSVSRLSEAFDFEEEGVFDDVPEMRLVPGIFRPIQFDIALIVVEYSLWDFRYWMPRRVRVEGSVRAGALRLPGVLEETYQVLDVTGAPDPGAAGPPPADPEPPGADLEPPDPDIDSPEAVAARWQEEGRYGEYRLLREDEAGDGDGATGDEDAEETEDRDPDGVEDVDGPDGTARADEADEPVRIVLVPVDSTRLHDLEWLPPPIWEEAPGFTSDDAREEFADLLADLQIPPPARRGIRLAWGYQGSGLLRYNRAEGFSIGARAGWEPPFSVGPDDVTATARLGMGTWVPDGRLEVAWTGSGPEFSIAGYHSVTPVDPSARSLGLGNSAAALFFGRDDGDYFRATGARLSLAPGALERPWYELYLSAEEHRPLPARADFSVFGGSDPFRAALDADRVREYRVGARIAPSWGSSLFGAHGGLELLLDHGRGDRRWTRVGATGRLGLPLFAELRAGVELAGGHVWGDPPAQRQWFLGGTRTLRGYEGASAVGPTYGRGRADLSWGTPAGRFSIFGDAGWAGNLDRYDSDEILVSAGAGFSFLEGLLRVDLARALRAPTGWKLEVHLDSFH